MAAVCSLGRSIRGLVLCPLLLAGVLTTRVAGA
jgi:hypothetical protein